MAVVNNSINLLEGLAGQLITNTGTGFTSTTATYPSIATTTGTLLRANGTNWVKTTATFADTYAASTILYSNGANTIQGLTTANNGLLVTGATGIPSILAGPGTTGNILQSNAALAPSFSTATFPSVATSAGTILRANGTNWLASTSTFADTYAINTILYAGTANTITGLTPAASSVLVSNGSDVPSWSTTLPNFTTGAITFSPTTGGIVGTTTNDNAGAGKVGEFVSSQILTGSPTTGFANNTPKDITSISLTAGDWDVWGNIIVIFSGTGTVIVGWINNASATQPDSSKTSNVIQGTSLSSTSAITVPYIRMSLAGTTTIYLSALAQFSSGTCAFAGGIFARRAR